MYKFTVIGNPVVHSKSPRIHAHFAEQKKLSIHYDKTEAPLNLFKETVLAFQRIGGHGANVTIPFKEEAYLLASTLTERASIAKAVNTLKFMPDGSIYGDNTDGVGLIKDIKVNNGFHLNNLKILFIGSGGASRGILHPILKEEPREIVIANRTKDKADKLAKEFSAYGKISAVSIDKISGYFDVIIDCTPFSAWPLPIPCEVFSECSLVYDLKYNQRQTPILEKGNLYGAKLCLDGAGMLIEQAAESFSVWTGLFPDTKNILQEIHNEK
jgi:shikimate dehydrogenase